MAALVEVCAGLPLDPLPAPRLRDPFLPHAPVRTPQLTFEERKVVKMLSSAVKKFVFSKLFGLCVYLLFFFFLFVFFWDQLAVRNALRYFPSRYHAELAPEFALELTNYGHIYMYRFRPPLQMKAYPVRDYPANLVQAAGIMHMLMNNLAPEVAQVKSCYVHVLV